jgi:integrase/recombinase XerD
MRPIGTLPPVHPTLSTHTYSTSRRYSHAPLPQRLIEAIPLRGLAARTQESYVRALRQLAEHSPQSPARLTEEELRDYFLSLKNVKHYSRSASTIALCGITSFYEHPLKRAGPPLTLVRAPREKQLPGLLRVAEVRTILAHLKLLRYRVCLTTLYSWGLRLQEGPHLQVPAIDAARLLGHVRHGKGAKDRAVPLPPSTLKLLRQYWKTHRSPLWLFPAPGCGGIGMSTASEPLPSSRVQETFRVALRQSGSHKQASVHTRRHSSAPPRLAAGGNVRLIQDSLGHNTPTPTAIALPRPVKADAMARPARMALMSDL